MSELKVHRFITTDELFPEANAGALYYLKSEADKVIAELKEERRWRKFPDEKPEHNGIFIVLLGEHTRTLDAYDKDKGKFRTYMPTAWMPLPSAPKEDK